MVYFQELFGKITEDLFTDNPEYCNVIHSAERERNPFWDTCGTGRPAMQAMWDRPRQHSDELGRSGMRGNMGSSRAIQYGQQERTNFPGEALAALIEGIKLFCKPWPTTGSA